MRNFVFDVKYVSDRKKQKCLLTKCSINTHLLPPLPPAGIGAHPTHPHPLFKFQSQYKEQVNYLCTYDLYGPVRNVLDAGISIIRGQVGGG
jgi:hypothetical protein